MEIKKELEELFKDKSDMTRKTYISRIIAVKNLLEYVKDDLEFLKNGKKVIKAIEISDWKTSSKKITYTSLVLLSKLLNLEDNKLYYEKMIEYKEKNEDEINENKINEEVNKNWATLDELRDMYIKMPEDKPEDIQDKLLIALYIFMPPLRNDYAKVRVFNRGIRKYEGNYILNLKNKVEFILQEYKTSDKYGTIRYVYDDKTQPELYRMFKKHFEHNDTNYLLIKYNDTRRALNDKDISKLIPSIFEKYLNKHITIQLLRVIYETELQQDEKYLNLSNKQRNEKHKELLHSTGVALQYRKINTKKNKNNIV